MDNLIKIKNWSKNRRKFWYLYPGIFAIAFWTLFHCSVIVKTYLEYKTNYQIKLMTDPAYHFPGLTICTNNRQVNSTFLLINFSNLKKLFYLEIY